MTADAAGDRREVIVVGGGQAGLAIGYLLAQQGRQFTILEAADTPAAAWRERWDSLRLFTPVRYDSLPGRAFPGDPDSYPGRDDVVAYLTDYARDFELPVELSSRVRAVRQGERGYLVELDDRSYEADQVVIATGPFQIPRVPAIAERLDPDITQFHSSKYRGPQDVPAGPVLVVGGGNTGYQIAEELARTAQGAPVDRRPPDAVAAADPGPRPVPLPRSHRPDGQDRRVADRPAHATPRDADRLEPSRRPTPARHRAARPNRRRVRVRGALQRRRPAQSRRGHLGDRLRARPLVRAAARSSTRTAASCTSAASPHRPGCTSSGCRGSTRAARRCWAGSRTTPSTSPTTSPPSRAPARARRRSRPSRGSDSRHINHGRARAECSGRSRRSGAGTRRGHEGLAWPRLGEARRTPA